MRLSIPIKGKSISVEVVNIINGFESRIGSVSPEDPDASDNRFQKLNLPLDVTIEGSREP